MKPMILGPDDGERLVIHGANIMTFKAIAEDTAGQFSLCHYEAVAGWPGPELHAHSDFEEAFYVLEGEFEFHIGSESVRTRAGAFLLVPRGVEHAFSNPTGAPARLLGIFSPAGAEKAFRRRAQIE